MHRKFLLGSLIASVMVARVAEADPLKLITSRADLNGNHTVDWGAAGPPGTLLGSNFSVDSLTASTQPIVGGLPPFNQMYIGEECSGPSVFPCIWGNFPTGDTVLFTGQSSSPLTITFDKGVKAAGLQLLQNTEDVYTATIEAFTTTNDLMGSFTVTGLWDRVPGDAMFLGVDDGGFKIGKIVFEVDGPSAQNGFVVNELSERVQVPEPNSSIVMLSTMLGAAGLLLLLTPSRWFMSKRNWGEAGSP